MPAKRKQPKNKTIRVTAREYNNRKYREISYAAQGAYSRTVNTAADEFRAIRDKAQKTYEDATKVQLAAYHSVIKPAAKKEEEINIKASKLLNETCEKARKKYRIL